MASGKIYNYFPIQTSVTLYSPSTMTEMVPGTTEIQLTQSMLDFSFVYVVCYINGTASSDRAVVTVPSTFLGIKAWYPAGTSSGVASVRFGAGTTSGSEDSSKLTVVNYINVTKFYIIRVYGVR